MPPPCLLALDTATETLSVGLCWPGGRRAVDEAGGARASARIVPLVGDLLAQAGLRPNALQAIAFGRGPGAFTGLRTACAVAQGLALGVGCPVLAIDSLLVVAEAHAPQGVQPVWVAMDARMDEVYAAAYGRNGPDWVVRQSPALYTLDALDAAWQAVPPSAVVGSAVTAFADRLDFHGATTADGHGGRAAALLRLAEAAWAGGAPRLDAADALPLYLRDKVALTTAERLARSAG